MIVFDLICSDGHRFESWFRSGDAYEAQSRQNAIACPVCGDTAVSKAPVRLFVARGDRHRDGATDGSRPEAQAPPGSASGSGTGSCGVGPAAVEADTGSSPEPPSAPSSESPPMQQALRMLRTLIEASCDDVGRGFAEEARKIHYGESAARGIYGEASAEEASALHEEGIEIQSLPWMRRRHD
ncbi:MAG: DUF1178 family protein [Rhodospirillales bacterium]